MREVSVSIVGLGHRYVVYYSLKCLIRVFHNALQC